MWNHFRDKVNDDVSENNNVGNYRINNNKITTIKSLEYKTKTMGDTPADNSRLDSCHYIKIFEEPLQSLDLCLINCEIELGLRWTKIV